jgi:hypothetical protein
MRRWQLQQEAANKAVYCEAVEASYVLLAVEDEHGEGNTDI